MNVRRDGVAAFDEKAATYELGRPRYATAALERAQALMANGTRTAASLVVADIGAGTGLLTRDLARSFGHVVAIEPNEDMRHVLRESMGECASLDIRSGSAELTGLSDASVDAIFAAQAFHWFDVPRARSEFRRILRGEKWVFLLWNMRKGGVDPAADELGRMMAAMRWGGDVANPGPAPGPLEAVPDELREFFLPGTYQHLDFENPARLTRDELRAMVMSRSYAPPRSDPAYDRTVGAIDKIFDQFSSRGTFLVPYVTELHFGRV